MRMVLLGRLLEQVFRDCVEMARLAAVFSKAIFEEQLHMLIYVITGVSLLKGQQHHI